MSGFFGKYNHRENPIMPYIYRENGKFIHSYANHDRFQNLNVGMNVRVGMLWDILQLSGSISNDTRWSRGINYNHHHNSLGWSLEAAMLYKKFVFSARYQKNTDYLFGEKRDSLYFSFPAHGVHTVIHGYSQPCLHH